MNRLHDALLTAPEVEPQMRIHQFSHRQFHA